MIVEITECSEGYQIASKIKIKNKRGEEVTLDIAEIASPSPKSIGGAIWLVIKNYRKMLLANKDNLTDPVQLQDALAGG